ncbi:MAG: imidazole glycerol phosphate synthase subunit HisH [Bacteroidia bacterium]|nr:imidazole glycerol phosphate synthase subunit HisH [Bacteroidia bacterium]
MKIGVIAYRGGNVRSICSALESLGVELLYTAEWEQLRGCAGLIFPGVGAALPAVQDLQRTCLWEKLPTWDRPFLGVCLGMQLLGKESEEGPAPGLGVFSYAVRPFREAPRVIHMGWNAVSPLMQDPLWYGIESPFYVYFVHGYRADVMDCTIAEAVYGERFSAAVRRENFWGVQFHPEKSGEVGFKVLQNFLSICKSYQP